MGKCTILQAILQLTDKAQGNGPHNILYLTSHFYDSHSGLVELLNPFEGDRREFK